MNVPDEEKLANLLVELKKGNEPAFNLVYLSYAKMLHKRIFTIVKDETIAEELLQDLFLRIWQKRQHINPEKSFKSFLYTVANNLVYDYLRKVASHKRAMNNLLMNANDCYLHIEEALDAKETERKLQDAIFRLPPQQKQVFMLCKMEGKSYMEVSRILQISIATVNSHIVKSNRFVKLCLQHN
jgi:RNA polymerase sigma-70 factor (ECF subfamily)